MARMIAEVYRTFRAANVPEEQAEAAARAVAEAGEGLVSNQTLRLELAALRQELKAEIADLRTDMHAQIAKLRAEIHAEIVKLRTEMHAGIAKLGTEMHTLIAASEERVTRKLYALFGALAVLITVFEFIN